MCAAKGFLGTLSVEIAKTSKYASRESGDTVETVERPDGGTSVVLVDGQGSGTGAKSLSLMLTTKAVTLLKDGVRDGAVARAVHDTLFAVRQGRVSASMEIVSLDAQSSQVVLTRNSTTPAFVWKGSSWEVVSEAGGPIGYQRFSRPAVFTWDVDAGFAVVLVSDGFLHPSRSDVSDRPHHEWIEEWLTDVTPGSDLADALLNRALEREAGRPRDDLTAICLRTEPTQAQPHVRRLRLSVPMARLYR